MLTHNTHLRFFIGCAIRLHFLKEVFFSFFKNNLFIYVSNAKRFKKKKRHQTGTERKSPTAGRSCVSVQTNVERLVGGKVRGKGWEAVGEEVGQVSMGTSSSEVLSSERGMSSTSSSDEEEEEEKEGEAERGT